MTTATATPSCRVTRSSRDTPRAAGRGGPAAGVAGRAGPTGLVPLPSGWGGNPLGGGLVLVGRSQHLDRGQVIDLHSRVGHCRVHGHGQGDQAAAAEPGPQPDPHRRQMPIHQQPPPGLELPQRLRRQQPAIRHRLSQGGPAVAAGGLRGLGDGFVADQLGRQLQGGRIRLAGQQQLGPMPVQDRRRPVAVAVLELGLVVPDGQQLDAPWPRPVVASWGSFLMAAQCPASSRHTNSRGSSIPSGCAAASCSAL